ncbi:SET domain-containing protein [Oxalobacteraceae bacterium GrIS 2.11]
MGKKKTRLRLRQFFFLIHFEPKNPGDCTWGQVKSNCNPNVKSNCNPNVKSNCNPNVKSNCNPNCNPNVKNNCNPNTHNFHD